MTKARDAKKKTADPLERRKLEEHQPDESSRQHSLLHLQRAAGNRAVVHLLQSHGHLQTKLGISGPGDEHEQEADRASEQVWRLTTSPTGVVQRKCSACSPIATCAACAEEEETVQRKTKSASKFSSTGPILQRKAKNSSVLSSIAPHIQRAPRNGGSTTADVAPEPDATAAGAGALIVEDDAASVAAGQMRKSEFLEQLRSAVCATADEALKEAGQSTEGCPYIEQWLGYYAGREPAHIERALRKYAPEAAGATSAGDYIPAVSNRVRVAVDRWARTGEITGVPPELAGLLSGPGVALGAIAGMIGGALSGIGSAIGGALSAAAGAVGSAFSSIGKALFKRKEGPGEASDGATNDANAIQQQLSGGQTLDADAKARMGAAFGHDFSGVRVHTNAEAAGLSDRLNARAFTVGTDIAFGPGEYQPGTLIGDALIAHELAHVVQQQGGGNGSSSPQSKGDSGHDSLEDDADVAAVGAVVSVWGGLQGQLRNVGRNAMPRLKSGLRLQSCRKEYVTNRGANVTTLSSGAPPLAPDVTEAQADATLNGYGLLSKVIKLAPPTNDYDCHGFTFLGGDRWINDDQVDAILTDNGYVITTAPVVGDIVVYRKGGAITHSGIIVAVAGGTVTRIHSKWGRLGRYSHAPNDVPPTYGTWETYHTSRPGGHRLRERP